ncbi:YceI family protein [Hymenobacter psychrophilus]|uniref:YceI-like domain-containing protein n=1 Tax=Hymenobacter psychrophilus TaxID=651662 RepID=A0A1H3NS05_9BACT|nr:YceI family protein [Hymenobacter psychrophilus]SDY90959.1 YceI-like domain-containing protein [Hymenobacter psychrophilus]
MTKPLLLKVPGTRTAARWGLAVLLLSGALATPARAQGKYLTQEGAASFFSTSIIEDIEATTKQVAAVFDLHSGQLAFSIPVKSFAFKRTLMQEHFNENYLESDKYPKATFRGRIVDLDMGKLLKDGQRVSVEGDITIHGVTRRLTVPGALAFSQGSLLVNAYFSISPADYGIEIPRLVRENIAKIVGIKVSLICEPVSQLSAK